MNVLEALAEVLEEGARYSRGWSMNGDRQQDAQVYEAMAVKARQLAAEVTP